jgi:hypothetical protein
MQTKACGVWGYTWETRNHGKWEFFWAHDDTGAIAQQVTMSCRPGTHSYRVHMAVVGLASTGDISENGKAVAGAEVTRRRGRTGRQAHLLIVTAVAPGTRAGRLSRFTGCRVEAGGRRDCATDINVMVAVRGSRCALSFAFNVAFAVSGS